MKRVILIENGDSELHAAVTKAIADAETRGAILDIKVIDGDSDEMPKWARDAERDVYEAFERDGGKPPVGKRGGGWARWLPFS